MTEVVIENPELEDEVPVPVEGCAAFDEMALSKPDKEYIAEEIKKVQDAVSAEIRSALYPNGLGKAAHFLRYWGGIAIPFTVILGFMAITYAAANFAWSEMAANREFRGMVTAELKSLRKDVDGLAAREGKAEVEKESKRPDFAQRLPMLLEQGVQDIAAGSTSIGVAMVVNLTKQGQEMGITADQEQTSRIGQQLLQIAKRDSTDSTWEAMQKLLSYHTIIDADDLPAGVPRPTMFPPLREGFAVTEEANRLRELTHVGIKPFGVAPRPELRALMIRYGEKSEWDKYVESLYADPHAPRAAWNLTYGTHGDSQYSIGSVHIRRFIFQDLTIVYTGGRVTLEDVYFINCKFRMIRTPDSQKLVSAILEPRGTSVQIN